jgi:hypothetical protein
MASSSITLSIGTMSFAAEGENEDWTSAQLDKFFVGSGKVGQAVAPFVARESAGRFFGVGKSQRDAC